MKHPALILRGTGTGQHVFIITDEKGQTVAQSPPYDTEDDVKLASGRIGSLVLEAKLNKIDQLPSTIAHK